MKLNRKWFLVIALVLSMTMAIGGTLAYLTDRDSAANVLTFGNVDIELNEDFSQGSELIPGVDVNKDVTITNTGKNNAWVWFTYAIPSALDNDDASKNVVHVNIPGANWLAHRENTKYWAEGQTEATPAEQCWIVDYTVAKDQTIDASGVKYNVYTSLYNGMLQPGVTTTVGMTKVYLDKHVDIDPSGDVYHVENGEVTGPYWNINTNGAPVIHVSAYAIQSDGFEKVEDAYAAYTAQWGENGGSAYSEPATAVATAEELQSALKNGESVVLTEDIELATYVTIDSDKEVTIDLAGHAIRFAKTCLYVNNEKAVVNIRGNGAVMSEAKEAIFVNAGTVNVYEGNFAGGVAVYVINNGIANIYGGTFEGGEHQGSYWPLNEYDATRSATEINVYGGSFLNFDPSNNAAEGAGTNFVAEGYKVSSETTADGNTWYYVTAE